MPTDEPGWVVDTSGYTHLSRAGHGDLFARLAPDGRVLVPVEVQTEVERGRDTHAGIASVPDTPWAQVVVLTDEEVLTLLRVKAAMGGTASEHLGECAVIAVAHHRGLVAILDEREAVEQADLLGVTSYDTLRVVVEAFKRDGDRLAAEARVDDLLATGMYLPIKDGKSLFALAYEEGWLP